MKIEDVHSVDELGEYIVDNHYKEDDFGNYEELMCRIEKKIEELWSNEDNDESEDMIDFLGSTITLYRVIPQNWNGENMESIEDGNIGMSWVSKFEDLERVPWYNEDDSVVVKVEVPINDKSYIAFDNWLDCVVEVVLPNACKKYKVKYVTKG